MKKAVFLGNADTTANVYPEEVMTRLRERLDICEHVIDKKDLDAYREVLRDAEYAFSTWGMFRFTREEIREYLPRLKAVFYGAGSVQSFARDFLEEGVAVFSAWAANGVPVAEYTFAQIVLASKGFFQRLHMPSTGAAWPNKNPGVRFPGNYGIRVGILGTGMIGRMVIERLKTLDKVEILVFDPFLSDEKAAAMGVQKTDLDSIFSECDIISNHIANNPQTVGMLYRWHFDAMKEHAVFINTARGAQVVEEDLIAALYSVPTRAAVLDVTEPEPPEVDSPLYTMENVFLTPHIAGSLGNEVYRMAEYMLEEFCAFDAGKPTRYSVTLEMLETMA